MNQNLTLDRLENRTIQIAIMEEDHKELQSAITQNMADIQQCHYSILGGDPIALLIGEQQMALRNQAGMLTHERWAESPFGFHYLCDLETMLGFLPNAWLSSDGVNGAISGLVGTPQQAAARAVQYMSSDWVANIHSNLQADVPLDPDWIPALKPETEMIVFPLNVDQAHWVAVLVTCKGGTLRIWLYNSLAPLGNRSAIVRNLPRIIKAVITANPDATRWTEARWVQKQISAVRTLQQDNLDDCGIFAVRTCLSLLQRRAPSLTLSDSILALRERYLRAYIDGVNRAPEHAFVDVTLDQTTRKETDGNLLAGEDP